MRRKKLTTVIDNSGISAVTKKTDSNGKVESLTNLAQGMYLVEEKDSASYGMFSPFLVAIPYMEDGQNWIYDVETYTKGVSNQQGSLEVTKALVYMDPETGKIYNLQAPESYEEENGESRSKILCWTVLRCRWNDSLWKELFEDN